MEWLVVNFGRSSGVLPLSLDHINGLRPFSVTWTWKSWKRFGKTRFRAGAICAILDLRTHVSSAVNYRILSAGIHLQARFCSLILRDISSVNISDQSS